MQFAKDINNKDAYKCLRGSNESEIILGVNKQKMKCKNIADCRSGCTTKWTHLEGFLAFAEALA